MNQLLWCSVAYTHACTVLPEGPISRGLLTTFAPFMQSRQHRPPHRDSLTTVLQTGQGRKAALVQVYSCLMKAHQSAFMPSGVGIRKIFLGIIESWDLSSGGIERMLSSGSYLCTQLGTCITSHWPKFEIFNKKMYLSPMYDLKALNFVKFCLFVYTYIFS